MRQRAPKSKNEAKPRDREEGTHGLQGMGLPSGYLPYLLEASLLSHTLAGDTVGETG